MQQHKQQHIGNGGIDLSLKLPSAVDVEQMILGTILMNPTAILETTSILLPEHFYHETNARIYEKMVWMDRRTMIIDIMTVVEQFSKDGLIGDEPGKITPYYITKMTSNVPPFYISQRLTEQCLIVLQKFIARQQMKMGLELYQRASSGADFAETNDWLLGEQEKLWTNVLRVKVQDYNTLVFNRFQEIIHNDGSIPPGLLTGFPSIDKIILGAMPGELIVIAARPSMGKTAFMVQLLQNFSKKDPAGIIELESSKGSFIDRHLANISGVSATRLKMGALEEEHKKLVYEAAEEIYKHQIYVQFDSMQNIYQIATIIRSWVLKHKVKVVLIDYLQIINTMPEDERKNRERQVAQMSQGLAALAVQLNISIIVFAQLSREVLKRAGNRPNLGDLRESGGIEAAARQVWFIHRPEYYGEKEDEFGNDLTGVTEIIIQKNNEGGIGTARLRFDPTLSRFKDMEDNLWAGPAPTDFSSPTKPMNLPGVDTDLWDKDTPF